MNASWTTEAEGRKLVWPLVVAIAMATMLSTAIPSPARAETSHASPRETITTWGTPYCRDAGAAVDVSVTIDPEVYPEGTYVAFIIENENYSSQDTDLSAMHAYTDENGFAEVAVPLDRKLYGTELLTDVTWIDISWSAGKDADGFDIWVEGEGNAYHFPEKCNTPVPPAAPVCVLETGYGYATIEYRGVRRTLHFSPSTMLPKVCVSVAEANAWAKRLGIG